MIDLVVLNALYNLSFSFSSCHQARMREDKAPSAAHRVQVLPDNARWSRDSVDQMVRVRGRLQRDGHGAVGALVGGPVQLLLEKVQPEDCPTFGGPAHLSHRIHP